MSLYDLVSVVVVFGLLIALHELGHFILARVNGVRVLEYSIGFGPKLWSRDGKATTYSLRAIPLGGFVRLAGIDDEATGPASFNAKSVWRRVTIIAAGAVTNLILAAILFAIARTPYAGAPVHVVNVSKDLPAARAGIQRGDTLLAINGRSISRDQDFRDVVQTSHGSAVEVRVRHPSGAEQTYSIQPVTSADKRLVIGVLLQGSADLGQGVAQGLGDWRDAVVAIPVGLYDLGSGKIPGGFTGPCGLSGPVGIVRATASAAEAGILNLLQIAGFISLNLGILNLLPLPALDGGRLLFLAIEAVRRKPTNPELEQRVHYIGLVVLLGLVAVISYKDLLQFGTPLANLVQQCR